METNVYTVRFRQREGSLQPEYVDTHVVLADTPENAESEVRAKLLRQGIGLVSLVDINILGTGRHINGELGVKAIKVSSVDRTWLEPKDWRKPPPLTDAGALGRVINKHPSKDVQGILADLNGMGWFLVRENEVR